jgi:hypothetical protein
LLKPDVTTAFDKEQYQLHVFSDQDTGYDETKGKQQQLAQQI